MTPDEAEKLTDLLLLELEKRITEAYDDALEGITAEIAGYFLKFRKRDAEMRARLDAGEIAAEYYKQWRLNQIGRGERLETMAQQVAARLTDTSVTAAEYINDSLPLVYAENRAWTAYSVDRLTGGALTFGGGSMGIDFTLWDEHTVRRLLREQPETMPNYPEARAVRRGIDLAYGKSQIHKQVTSSILAGDSIPKMADKLQERITTMSRASAIRAARTAVTSAQNGGRQDGFADAAKMGISVRKRWVATKDMRTRPEHGAADGQTVETDQPFDVGGEALMFPGDPSGSPANIYNCRCTMRSVEPDGIEAEPRMMRVRDANGNSVVVPEMTYDEWKKWVQTGKLPEKGVAKTAGRGIIITDEQFGKKLGRHSKDYGLSPEKAEDRDAFRRIINDIYNNSEERRTGEWRGQEGLVRFYIKGEDVVITDLDNNFISVLKGGVNNERVKNARIERV